MPEYIQYDVNGYIIEKWYSVDPSIVAGKENIIHVDRDIFKQLTKYWIVDKGQVREMTQEEKDALDQAEYDEKIAKEQDRINNHELTMPELVEVLIKKGIINRFSNRLKAT